ncbi:MAG: hypothetical protein AMS24_00965 [Chlamydiae bacterium SM23_39]|nr:MAG: hypothetical protein AMS24_00965 [Chlamydiae bacterium SM23_39]
MKRYLFITSILIFSCSFTLEKKPWFGNVYELSLLSKYEYFYFSSVDSATKPLKKTNHNNKLHFNLSFPFSSQISIDSDLELINSPRQSFNINYVGTQLRYLIFDDITGDIVSFVTSTNLKISPKKSVEDISCYSMGEVTFEGNISLGKEFLKKEFWVYRIWAFSALSIANRGSPAISLTLSMDGNFYDDYICACQLDFKHGYGKKTKINIKHFKGYGRLREKSVDLSFKFGKKFKRGFIFLEYKRRILAHICPKKVNSFIIKSIISFSF